MMATQQSITFFKLKNAHEYRFYGRLGRRQVSFQKGEVVEVRDPKDISYFRARGDVLVECDRDGIPLDELGRIGHLVDGKPIEYRLYGRRSKPAEQPAPPKTVTIQSPKAPARTVPKLPAPPTRLSPLEEVQSDGTSRSVRPAVDPGF